MQYFNDTFDLNENTFVLYAAKHYENPHCHSTDEFYEDLRRFIQIKKMLTKYRKSGEIKERLFVNHIICIFNIFKPFAASKMIFYKAGEDYYPHIKAVLKHIERCPKMMLINGKVVDTDTIQIDEIFYNLLERND